MTTHRLLTPGQVAKKLGIRSSSVKDLEYSWLFPVLTHDGRRYRSSEVETLLTRNSVAKLLHKSVAAVRAIEGTLLHPDEGPDGVRLFDIDEVRRLVGRSLGRHAHTDWLRNQKRKEQRTQRSSSDDVLVEQLRAQLVESRAENEELRMTLAELLEGLEQLQR